MIEEAEKPYVVSTPDVCFGHPRLNNTRMPVRTIQAVYEAEGSTIEGVLQQYPHLTPEQIEVALEYELQDIVSERTIDGQVFRFEILEEDDALTISQGEYSDEYDIVVPLNEMHVFIGEVLDMWMKYNERERAKLEEAEE